jgi:hypothetical protein
MRLSTTLDHLGLPRFLHHRGRGNAVFIESPRDHHHPGTGAGQERWRADSYSDPWPDRA